MKLFEYMAEGGKNYLKTAEAKKGDYITEMLIHNKIPGFVCPQLKSRNDENFIAYPVNGLIPLTQLVEVKKLSASVLENLLLSFLKACRGMEDYLLPPDRLIVEPEHIYRNYVKKEEFFWIYGGEETGGRNIVTLFEFLLEKMDYTDDRAVKMVYSLYQSCKDYEEVFEGNMGEEGIGIIREKTEELLSAEKTDLEQKVWAKIEQENRLRFSADIEEKRGEEVFFGKPEERAEMEEGPLFSEPVKERKRREKKGGKAQKTKKIWKTGKMRERISSAETMRGILTKAWNYFTADIGAKEREQVCVVEEEREPYRHGEVKVVRKERKEESIRGEATTLLTNGMVHSGMYCLKPEDKEESSILITSYPFFIGKAENEVQYRIDDSTVSRFHARIDRTEDAFWLTDLSSTNGTFLNGIRLLPYEKMSLSSEDRITVSRKRYKFVYLN